jgi:hypothetical protein
MTADVKSRLQKRICPNMVFIDSERGLDKAVNRLRDVLEDRSAQRGSEGSQAILRVKTLDKREVG